MIYYMLFLVLIIPFQILCDLFFFNISVQYLKIDITEFLTLSKKMFDKRKSKWKTQIWNSNDKVSKIWDSVYQWSFSS